MLARRSTISARVDRVVGVDQTVGVDCGPHGPQARVGLLVISAANIGRDLCEVQIAGARRPRRHGARQCLSVSGDCRADLGRGGDPDGEQRVRRIQPGQRAVLLGDPRERAAELAQFGGQQR